jgi:hypothetical protein
MLETFVEYEDDRPVAMAVNKWRTFRLHEGWHQSQYVTTNARASSSSLDEITYTEMAPISMLL